MKCPRDQTLLEEVVADGVTVSVCPSCHGLLLHQDQFESIRERTKIAYPNTSRTVVEVLEQTARSPVNGERMKVIEHEGIKIDICLSSNFIWFDYGELEELFRNKNKNFKLGSKQPFNVFDALDVLHLADFISELLGSVFEGATNLIDL